MKRIILLYLLLLVSGFCFSQRSDSLVINKEGQAILQNGIRESVTDSIRKAEIRRVVLHSAILPGWGQIDNKKYWKLPIVYGGLGTAAYLFFQNLNQFRESRNAYRLATDGDLTNDHLIVQPYFNVRMQPDRIAVFRNSVRQNVDYSVLFFLGIWALNVADAAVDAHLKDFDVSDDISLQIKAGYTPLANTAGLIVSFSIK